MNDPLQHHGMNPAADVIRQKVSQLYKDEPNARQELSRAVSHPTHRSKHQQYMYDLSRSGRSLADIQTAWHNYYLGLPDHEKHQVWQEFYDEHTRQQAPHSPHHGVVVGEMQPPTPTTPAEPRTVAKIKKDLLTRVSKQSRRKRGSHLKSLGFGLVCGMVTMVVLLFSFFNERFIAPFISPSRSVSNTPIIIDANGTVATSKDPEIIIPKINVQIPVIYTVPTIEENAVERGLEDGVVHYATTPNPGELGNGVIFGHSSNNIFNKGKYKFAFVLLKRLENGDTFILQKDGKRYVYKVFSKKVVRPEDVSVLGNIPGHTATFTLITCDPPGTSLNRLIVSAEQITPDPNKNTASAVKGTQPTPVILPSNSPSLWSRFVHWLTD